MVVIYPSLLRSAVMQVALTVLQPATVQDRLSTHFPVQSTLVRRFKDLMKRYPAFRTTVFFVYPADKPRDDVMAKMDFKAQFTCK